MAAMAAAEFGGEAAPDETMAPFSATGSAQGFPGAEMTASGPLYEEATEEFEDQDDAASRPGCRPKPRYTEEEKFARDVARRRQLDMERRVRIFNAKVRTIGVDKDFLDQQCAANATKHRATRQVEAVEDRHLLGVNRALQLQESMKGKIRHENERHCREFSLSELNYESRREFDLNDPKAVTKSYPARVGDEDPRCGPASMQQFGGEDLRKAERVRQQKIATVHALEQQMFEKEMLRRSNDGCDDEYVQQCLDVVELRNEVEAAEAARRTEIMGRYKHRLLSDAAGKEARKQGEAMLNQAENQRETDFHLSDPFLNETGGHLRPDGVIAKDRYKGSTRDERVEVFNKQLQQCDENRNRRSQEGTGGKAEARHQEQLRKQLIVMERDKQRMRKAIAAGVSERNQGQAAARRDGLAEAGPDAHRNKFAPEFFEQFGVSTR